MNVKLLILLFALTTASCKDEKGKETTITWDKWGVPHIKAANEEQLFYAQGRSQMHLHGNLILWLYGRGRGRGAEYWGSDYEPEARLIRTLGFPEVAVRWREQQDPKLKKLTAAFVRGMNDYASDHPNELEADKKVVLPIAYDDVNLHYLHTIYATFMAGEDIGGVMGRQDMGSNAYAVAPSRSASKNAMLVQNPHLPWFGEFTWMEMHLMTDSINAYGATLVGFPGLPIAFNENLGWSHTVNTIDAADAYELEVVDGDYLLDGKKTAFKKSTVSFRTKDASGKVNEEHLELLQSEHGPILRKSQSKALALRLPGLDASNALLEWWSMAKAKNFEQFETALKMQQLPYFNVIYADKQGNIFYLDNGFVPKRKKQERGYWNGIITGGKSEDIWTSLHTYDELPKVKNPPQGWLQNSNDPPWSCTFPMILKRTDFPDYISSRGMEFRPQRSAHMLFDDESITYDELVGYKMSTHLELADRVLDDLFAAVGRYGSPAAKGAVAVLEKWDRQAENNSRGTYLFYKWVWKLNPYSGNMFAVDWSENDPRATPDGLKDPKGAVRALEEVLEEIKREHRTPDMAWGDIVRLKMDSVDVPGNGMDGTFGVVRVTNPRDIVKDPVISGGDSWVGIIEFGDRLKANVLLSYGNASQPGSPHRGDQLKLFSEKKLRVAAFYQDDVAKSSVSVETLPFK